MNGRVKPAYLRGRVRAAPKPTTLSVSLPNALGEAVPNGGQPVCACERVALIVRYRNERIGLSQRRQAATYRPGCTPLFPAVRLQRREHAQRQGRIGRDLSRAEAASGYRSN
jgi:hypothetical protein